MTHLFLLMLAVLTSVFGYGLIGKSGGDLKYYAEYEPDQILKSGAIEYMLVGIASCCASVMLWICFVISMM